MKAFSPRAGDGFTATFPLRRANFQHLYLASVGLGSWLAAFSFPAAAGAHEHAQVREVVLTSSNASIGATWLLPDGATRVPCVVLVGGTLSQTRDGAMVASRVPARDALKRLAVKLAEAGYASLRFDRIGYGESKAKANWTGSYHDEAGAAAAAIQFARGQPESGPVIAAGESAGAYMLTLAAKDGLQADGYLFLGGLCSPAQDMYEYNFGRLARRAEESQEQLDWIKVHARRDLALGRHYQEMFEAAASGRNEFELVDDDFRMKLPLARRREELRFPPDDLFRYVRVPALALAGDRDLNVPPRHASRAAKIMRETGNTNAGAVLVAGADHSFQQAAPDAEVAWRERYTFESFKRPYVQEAYAVILSWLQVNFPTKGGNASRPMLAARALNQRATRAPEREPKTPTTPERLQLAPGIEIIDQITDPSVTVGVETLEGRIGPLLLAEGCQAHFIDMPAGLYVEEHPHSAESIIYTVRGRWVLCSQGRRHVMGPGSLFRFGANISTGYEIPFDEPAYILIFKGQRTTKAEKNFIDYLQGMAARLRQEQSRGTPFLLKELPENHPARKFAHEANPDWHPGGADAR